MRVIVAITGATGAIYGVKLLQELKRAGVETQLVISKWGRKTILLETGYTVEQVESMAHAVYDNDDLSALIASGSSHFAAMVVVPCSMKTLAGIRVGFTDNLVLRAADVSIKERRKLILLARETPLSPLHLENMLELSRLGAVIMPPVPAFYSKPETINDIVMQTTCRVLDQLGIENDGAPRWRGTLAE